MRRAVRIACSTLRPLSVWFLSVLGIELLALTIGILTTERAPAIGHWAEFLIIPAIFSAGVMPLCLLYGFDGGWSEPDRVGRCTSCGYDLTGLALDAVCPECGGRGA